MNIKDRVKDGNRFDGTRRELALLFAELGFTEGAEIGVNAGFYSQTLCKEIPNLKLFCIDPWDWSVDKMMEPCYYKCIKILSPYSGAIIMRMKSEEAVELVPDESLDFVYIDALHDYKNVLMDIELWEPKVRRGGIVSGHDYVNRRNFGVIQAVEEYTRSNNIFYFITTVVARRDNRPSWFWVKK